MGEHANETTQEPGTAGTSARHASLNRFSSDHEHRHPDESNFFTPHAAESTQHNCCVMPIPPLDLDTGNLPAGIHSATWEEILTTFGSSPRRLELLGGLRRGLESLRAA